MSLTGFSTYENNSEFINFYRSQHKKTLLKYFESKELYSPHTTQSLKNNKQPYRTLTFMRLGDFIQNGFIKKIYDNQDEMEYFSTFDTLHLIDGSFAIKFGVNFGLFGMTLKKFGGKDNIEASECIKKLVNGEIYGCFCMTELGHGSDVEHIGTKIIRENGKLYLHTGDNANKKYWIGNANDASHAIVFAKSDVGDGMCAVLVKVRNENHELTKGVKMDDCGHKIGLQGVDNGWFSFDKVEILDQNILVKNKPVKELLSSLTLGRVGLSSAVLNYAKSGLYIALKYAFARTQFFLGKYEVPIISYHSIQDRLVMDLCKLFTFVGATNKLKKMYILGNIQKAHMLSSGIKPVTTWFVLKCLQNCRESCGGHGYAVQNMIGTMRNDADIYTTFEGNNYVLLQQMMKGLLRKNADNLMGPITSVNLNGQIDTSQIIKMAKIRYSKMIQTLAKDMFLMYNSRTPLSKSMSKEEKQQFVWNHYQRKIYEVANAYLDYKVMQMAHRDMMFVKNNGLVLATLDVFAIHWLKTHCNELVEFGIKHNVKIVEGLYDTKLTNIVSNIHQYTELLEVPEKLLTSYMTNFNLSKL